MDPRTGNVNGAVGVIVGVWGGVGGGRGFFWWSRVPLSYYLVPVV